MVASTVEIEPVRVLAPTLTAEGFQARAVVEGVQA